MYDTHCDFTSIRENVPCGLSWMAKRGVAFKPTEISHEIFFGFGFIFGFLKNGKYLLSGKCH